MTEFGPEIPLDGKRPDWLIDDNQIIAFEDDERDWYGLGLSIWYARELDLERPRTLRLPADHAYYLATSRGFTYWPGGETAPSDWDGKDVLLRNGGTCRGKSVTHWGTVDFAPDAEIIGYRPKVKGQRVTYTGTQTPSRVGKTGTITGDPSHRDGGVWDDGALWCGYYRYNLTDSAEQVDEEHARQRFRRINNPPWHAGTAEDQHINVLKELGLIKPEPTRLERFLASTDDPTIEAALEFERD